MKILNDIEYDCGRLICLDVFPRRVCMSPEIHDAFLAYCEAGGYSVERITTTAGTLIVERDENETKYQIK